MNIREVDIMEKLANLFSNEMNDVYTYEGYDIRSDDLSPDYFTEIQFDDLFSISEKIITFQIDTINKLLSQEEKINADDIYRTVREHDISVIKSEMAHFYCCNRVWSAWSYNTMTQDDFCEVSEDDDFVESLANIAKAAFEDVWAYKEKDIILEELKEIPLSATPKKRI